MDVLGRYRNLIVLVGVLFAQVLGLAVQVKRTTDSEPTRLIRIWAVGAVTPLERVLVWVQTSTGNVWHNYFYLRGVRAENRNLKAQIERMSLEQVRISQDADQARRLQALLAFKEQFISRTMAAQVIGSSGSEQSRSVFIDKGYNDGIRPDMAVITADGIVGKVLRADPANSHVSQVLLIDDQTSGVGAILDKTRLQGILRGTPAGEVVLEKVMSDESVPAGEMVLTSGGDGIFPKGLRAGRVTKVAQGSDLFLNIHVRPAADLSRLEEVLVVTKIDERQAQPDQSGAARAVDILAERLPSVPAKPPEAAEKGVAPGSVTPGAVAPGAAPVVAPKTTGSDAKPEAPPSPGSGHSGTPAGGKSGSSAPAAAPGSSVPGSATRSTGSSGAVSGTASAGAASGPRASGTPAAKGSPKQVSPEKVSPKPVPPAVAPKSQPPVQDGPQ
jgi:rod shape-determining protein MreC